MLVATEDEFKQACAYQFRENFRPMRTVLIAASRAIVLTRLQDAAHRVPHGKPEVVSSDRTHLHLRIDAGPLLGGLLRGGLETSTKAVACAGQCQAQR